MKSIVLAFITVCISTVQIHSQKFEGLADTPPMGWISWNYFHCDGINEKVIMEIADGMVTSGMKDAGYEYIVIDDCWQTSRDGHGNIIADPEKFPSGIKYLSDYIHSKGLKFGIYSCAGTQTCQERPGSRGYEFQDARQYAAWGVDYLKYDWCHTGTQDAVSSYSIMRDALYQAGRPMVFSICEWGVNKPWNWAKDVGHLWRTTGDIRNNWNIPDAKDGKVWGGGVIIILDMQENLEKFSGPDGWNDMDMLEVGNGALTEAEERAHFSLWCMLAAPLMAGNDLRNMSEKTIEILTNKEAIEINQDSLGTQGYKIKDEGSFEIYYKPLVNNGIALCLFNRNQHPIKKTINWNDLPIEEKYFIRDVWEHQNIGTTAGSKTFRIDGHGVILLLLQSHSAE